MKSNNELYVYDADKELDKSRKELDKTLNECNDFFDRMEAKFKFMANPFGIEKESK